MGATDLKRVGAWSRLKRWVRGPSSGAVTKSVDPYTGSGSGFTNLGTNADPFWAVGGGLSSQLTAVQLASVWNYACSSLIAGSVATVKPLVTVDGQKRENHPLLDLLEEPTPDHGWDEWQYMRTLNLGLSGADYLELYRRDLNPSEPVIQMWPYGEGVYRTRVQDLARGRPVITHFERLGRRTEKERVIRSRFPAGGDYEKGLAPAFAAALESAGDRAAAIWQRCSYDNRTMPSAMIVLPTDDAETIKRFKATFLQGWINAANGRGPIVLGGGVADDMGGIQSSSAVSYQALTQTAIEADYVASRDASRKTITAIWNVPDVLFGASSSTFSNLADARLWYWQTTVLDYVNTLFDSLNRHLAPEYNAISGGQVKLIPDVSNIPALLPAVVEKTKHAKQLVDIGMPPKQASDRLSLGWEPWPGWDQSRVGPAGARFVLQSEELEQEEQVAQIALLEAEAEALDVEVEAADVEANNVLSMLGGQR